MRSGVPAVPPEDSALMRRALFIVLAASIAGAQEPSAGKKEFESLCAGCHGVDGGGGEYGPNIIDMRRFGQRTERSLLDVIKHGIPDSGMPAFALPANQVDA